MTSKISVPGEEPASDHLTQRVWETVGTEEAAVGIELISF